MNAAQIQVLLVEDNPVDARIIEGSLRRKQGHPQIEVERAEGLSDAMQRLRARSFAAVLLDLNLPDSSGLATFFALQAKSPHLPIVVLTGTDDEALALEAVQRGAQDYLVKGKVDAGLLERAVRYAIERKQVERVLAERAAELARVNALLRREVEELARAEQALDQERRRLVHSLELQERERQLISYEIHDGLVQLITAAKMNLEACRTDGEHDLRRAPETFTHGLQLLEEGIVEARRLMEGLCPTGLEQSGLRAAIEYLVSHARRPGGPEIEFHVDARFERLSAALETTIFRIVQEGLNNAIRHSKSDRIRIELVQRGNTVHIEVEDYGRGFDPDQVGAGRFGIRGMRDRARLFGGSLEVRVAPGDGACIVVDLPIPSTAASAANSSPES